MWENLLTRTCTGILLELVSTLCFELIQDCGYVQAYWSLSSLLAYAQTNVMSGPKSSCYLVSMTMPSAFFSLAAKMIWR